MTLIRMTRLGVCAGLTWLLCGCGSGPLDGPLTRFAIHDLDDARPAELEALRRAETGAQTQRDEVDALPKQFGVEDCVALALERNPGLLAAEQRVLRLHERIAQVTSLDDPMISIAPLGEMAETAAGQVGLMTSLSQRLPYPGKLETRGRIAQQDVEVARREYERVRLAVIADTRRAYWNLYLAARSLEVTRRSRDLLVQMREVVSARERAGGATQQSVLRIGVEVGNLENDLLGFAQKRTVAAAMLNQLLDRPVDGPVPDPEPVQLAPMDERIDALLARAQDANPEIQAARQRISQMRERREQARLNRFPDLTVGVTYNAVQDHGLSMAANGQDQWWFSLGANLPIWADRLDAAEREATRGLLETAASLNDTRNRIAFRVNDALAQVETQQRQAALLRDVIVPQASQAVESSLGGFRAGSVAFIDLIENWRQLLDLQLMYESTIASLERSVAELEEAVGGRIARTAPEVIEPAAAPPAQPHPEVQP